MNVVNQMMPGGGTSAAGQSTAAQSQGKEPSSFESMLQDKTQAAEAPQAEAGENSTPNTQTSSGGEGTTEEMSGDRYGLAAALLAWQPQTQLSVIQPATGQAPVNQAAAVTADAALAAPAESTAALPQELLSASQPVQVENAPVKAQPETGSQTVDVPSAEATEAQPQIRDGQSEVMSDSGGEKSGEDGQKTFESSAPDPQDGLLFRRVETVPVKVAQAPAGEMEPQAVAKQVAAPLKEALEQGASKIELSLSPRSLGNLTVEITRSGDGSLYVLLSAATEKAANLLERGSAGLQNLLGGNAQAPVKIEVQHQGGYQQQFLNPEDGGQGQHQQRQHHEPRKQEMTQDFIQQLRLGLIGLDEAVS